MVDLARSMEDARRGEGGDATTRTRPDPVRWAVMAALGIWLLPAIALVLAVGAIGVLLESATGDAVRGRRVAVAPRPLEALRRVGRGARAASL